MDKLYADFHNAMDYIREAYYDGQEPDLDDLVDTCDDIIASLRVAIDRLESTKMRAAKVSLALD